MQYKLLCAQIAQSMIQYLIGSKKLFLRIYNYKYIYSRLQYQMFDSDDQTKDSIKQPEQQIFPRKINPYLNSLQQLNKIQKISQGSFGKVYQYYNPYKNQFYAVKQMVFEGRHIKSHIIQIQRQINLLYKINNPFLVKLLDHFVRGNKIHLIMQFVDGNNLYDSFLKPKIRLQNRVLCEMIRDICQGLQYLHFNKIVHRDIKLENIMLSSKGEIKIIDLGQSNYFGQDVSRKTIRGTKSYFSPEIANRDLQDDRIDVWCLGVIIYQLICLQSPFVSSSNQQELFQNIRRFRYSKEKFKNDKLLVDLFSKIFTWHSERMTIQQLKNHPWVLKNLQMQNQAKFQELVAQKQTQQYKSLLASQIEKFKTKIKSVKEQNKQLQNKIQETKKEYRQLRT